MGAMHGRLGGQLCCGILQEWNDLQRLHRRVQHYPAMHADPGAPCGVMDSRQRRANARRELHECERKYGNQRDMRGVGNLHWRDDSKLRQRVCVAWRGLRKQRTDKQRNIADWLHFGYFNKFCK